MHNNVHIIGLPEGEKSEQGIENLYEEIMPENFPNLVKKKRYTIQEVQRVPIKMKPKRPSPRHIKSQISKVKNKERILKTTREKQLVTYKQAPIKLPADFSTETLQARRDWHKIFEVMKSKNLHQDYSIQQTYHLKWKEK